MLTAILGMLLARETTMSIRGKYISENVNKYPLKDGHSKTAGYI